VETGASLEEEEEQEEEEEGLFKANAVRRRRGFIEHCGLL